VKVKKIREKNVRGIKISEKRDALLLFVKNESEERKIFKFKMIYKDILK